MFGINFKKSSKNLYDAVYEESEHLNAFINSCT